MTSIIINPSTVAESPHEQSGPIISIVKTQQHLLRIQQAVLACRRNIQFSSLHKLSPVPFLDSDVIYSILPTVAAKDAAKEYDRKRDANEVLQQFEQLVRPATTSYYLESCHDDYFIPPGTMLELARKEKELLGNRAHSARNLDRILNYKHNQLSSNEWRQLTSRSLVKFVEQNVTEALGTDADLETLRSAIAKSSRASSDMLGKAVGKYAESVFTTISYYLNRKRPSYTQNNYCDAINAAVVAHVFERTGVSQGSRRSASQHHILPILISRTNEILNSPRWIGQIAEISQDSPELVSHPTLLGFLASLPSKFGAPVGGSADDDFIGQIENDIQRLLCLYNTLISDINIESLDPHDISLEQLRKHTNLLYQWEIIVHETQVFAERWFEYIGPIEARARSDRNVFINRLSLLNVRELFGNNDKDRMLQAISRLKKRLREIEYKSQNLLDTILAFSREGLTGSLVGIESRNSALEFLVTEDQMPNYLLSKTRPGAQIDICSIKNLSAKGVKRIIVHQALFRSVGAVLSIDLEEYRSNLYLRITWKHPLDSEEAWMTGASLINRWLADRNVTHISYHVFEAHEKDDIVGKFHHRNARLTYSKLGEETKELDYFEIGNHRCLFFADGISLCDTETQIGVVFPASDWTPQRANYLSQTMAKTSEAFGGYSELWNELLSQLILLD